MALAEWDRDFKVWSYAFSYSQLLFRSPPKFDDDLRVDVLFSNVRAMNIPTRLSGLKIEIADFSEMREHLNIGEVPNEPFELYVLNGGPHYILATQCQSHEDHEWVGAPSHFGPLRGVD